MGDIDNFIKLYKQIYSKNVYDKMKESKINQFGRFGLAKINEMIKTNHMKKPE